ncbi:MAG: HNH endonuclease signature motif containing protein [Anaerolineae bacterium]
MNKAEYNAYMRKMNALSLTEYEASPTFCMQCGKKIAYENRINRFCNNSCSATYTNQQRASPKSLCKCGNPVTGRHKWCDQCIENKQYNRKPFEAFKTDRARRSYLLRTRGHKCESCGLSEWLGRPITLELDHIDGNSDHNVLENLRLLCPNCHSFTPFWKAKVIGKEGSRQKNRRKRYANGQTW